MLRRARNTLLIDTLITKYTMLSVLARRGRFKSNLTRSEDAGPGGDCKVIGAMPQTNGPPFVAHRKGAIH
jgi:hypothetical protein